MRHSSYSQALICTLGSKAYYPLKLSTPAQPCLATNYRHGATGRHIPCTSTPPSTSTATRGNAESMQTDHTQQRTSQPQTLPRTQEIHPQPTETADISPTKTAHRNSLQEQPTETAHRNSRYITNGNEHPPQTPKLTRKTEQKQLETKRMDPPAAVLVQNVP